MVKPIITMTAALTGDKVGKMVYHDDYKDLLKAPNVRKEISKAGLRCILGASNVHELK